MNDTLAMVKPVFGVAAQTQTADKLTINNVYHPEATNVFALMAL